MTDPSTVAIPPRPMLPLAEQERAKRQMTRWALLHEECEDEAQAWMKLHVQEERLTSWGPPATELIVLASIARQLTTPGLYESPPRIGHTDARAGALVDPDGAFKASGLWPLQQHVQYLAVGMGECIVADDLTPAGWCHRVVAPFDVVVYCRPDMPEEPVIFRELRPRWDADREAWLWCWDVFDISDPANPSFHIETESVTEAGAMVRVTNLYATVDGDPAPAAGITGDRYVWRYPDGEPFIPRTVYRGVTTGRMWNTHHMRSAVIGTLNNVKLASFSHRAALDSAGSAAIANDIEVSPSGVQTANVDGSGTVQRRASLTPGTLLITRSQPEAKNPFVTVLGPGVNLPNLEAFTRSHATQIAMSWGLAPADVTRTGADPTSGAALAITEGGRIRFSRRVRPHFERADTMRLRKLAAMSYAVGYRGPVDGWIIEYTGLEATASEAEAERTQADWELARGYKSDVDVYMQLHPGVGPEAAREAIIRARVEAATLEAEVNRRLVAAGLPPRPPVTAESPPPSPTPTPKPPTGAGA